ncbi:MAG: hypothetical protein WCR36_10130 [Bacteroidaceae bacterium]
MMKENSNNDIQVDEHVYEVPHVERVEAQSERSFAASQSVQDNSERVTLDSWSKTEDADTGIWS